MKKVFIFGDCHTARILEHHYPEKISINLKMWGLAGSKIWDLNEKIVETIEKNSVSSGVESVTRQLNFDPKIKFNEFVDSDLIMPWLGYVDIRQFLPKYKNAEELVKNYVETILNTFKDKKIRFIEPLPQFTEMLLKYEGISPSYEYQERLEQNKLFLHYLTKYSQLANLMPPVSQIKIYQATGKKQFTPDMTHDKAPHPVDGLKDEYNEKIYNLFIEEIINTLNYYNV